ncbi:unnamed protein product [Callosobruchus maculatus]|uniref:Uncharacterized protein n=1 Tax=Callosobruchus maculatus TaxID=64391 RepID=A0A653CRU5_CALMS|nr:unnamed protein product [Callosobruchus maculatus]
MKCSGLVGLLLLWLATVSTMPSDTVTSRSQHAIGDSVKKLTKQLTDTNTTSMDVTLDVRTPPKIKQQIKNKLPQKEENSHAGIAIPIDEESLELEEANKMMTFYKIEKPTTDSGISTWILLSGQTSQTSSGTKKPVVDEKTKKGDSTTEKPPKVIKPYFKKKTTTTTTTIVPSTSTVATVTSTTTTEKATVKTTTTLLPKVVKETTKLTKVKASELSNAKRNASTTHIPSKKVHTTTSTTTTTTTTTVAPVTSTKIPTTTQGNANISTTNSSSALPAEAKQGELDLNKGGEKKKKTSAKKKKNKNRRRKPDGSLKKPSKTSVDKPIGTQLYNYLSREIMPTVGAGLVGLMITAGLAGYFLYPFGGIAKRNYDVDRKDKEGSYYYSDDYSNGILEEDAIGNIIAGMPQNTLYNNEYSKNQPSNVNNNHYQSPKYRLVDRKATIHPAQQHQQQIPEHMVKGTVESVPLDDFHHRRPYEDQQFVVGNVPTELTPATVPEHGPRLFRFAGDEGLQPHADSGMPRSIRIRRKRSGMSNDIDGDLPEENQTTTNPSPPTEESINTSTEITPTTPTISTSTEMLNNTESPISSFFDLMKDLIHIKARLGLQIIRNVTEGISKYISKVQTRLDEHYKNSTNRHYHHF